MGAISAIILAAGRGTRLQTPLPKAYIALGGKPLLAYSLEKFAECEDISELIVVIHPDDDELFHKLKLTLPKPITVVHGGSHRQDSSRAGVRAATGEYVLVHDAARPLVSRGLIERVIAAVRAHGAAVPVVPISDSVKRVSQDQIIADVDRSELFCAQTPQGFRRDLLLEVLERACAAGRSFTDESSAVLAMTGVQAKTVPGDERNIKITTAADLKLAESFIAPL